MAVDAYLSSPNAAAAAELRTTLAAWSKAAEDVRPLLASNSLLAEDLPVADEVTKLCGIGEQALDYASSGSPAGWKQNALDAIKDASRHTANLLLPFAPAVQKLVEVTR